MKKTPKSKTFLQGFLMGACDVIPGVSGGTIAFILGIYIRFIAAVKNITLKNILDSLKSPKKFKNLDFPFLSFLVLGILTAIIILSNLVLFLLTNYSSLTLIFFVGLILASAIIIFKEIDTHHIKTQIFAIIGLVITASMAFLNPTIVPAPTNIYIFLAGFVAISAMFLPGLSGAFILLVLGVYEFILNSLHNITTQYQVIFLFVAGIILGAFTISRVITFAYHQYKSETLYTLLGLIIGGLLIPLRRIYQETTFNIQTSLLMAIFFILGLITVTQIEKLKEKDY